MKKFLLATFSFILASVIAYPVLVIIWFFFAPRVLKKNISYRIGAYGHAFTRFNDLKNYKNIDVLCIGPSHSYRGCDPRTFERNNLKMFNLGTSSQTPIQTEILLKEFVMELNPKFVILDVYPVTFGDDGVESTLDLISNKKITEDIDSLAFTHNNIKVYNTLIYGHVRQKLHLNESFIEPVFKDDDKYISGGYIETYRQYSKMRKTKPRAINLLPKQVDAFKRCILYLKDRKIPFIITQSPITKPSYLSCLNKTEFDSFFVKLGTYYNFNEEFNMPNKFFLDDHHLNQHGVILYNKRVLQVLYSLGVKPDKNFN